MKFPAFILLALLLLILAACSPSTPTQEQNTFREICLEHGGTWNSAPHQTQTSAPGRACLGCSPNKHEHYCSQEEYDQAIAQGDVSTNPSPEPGDLTV